MPYMLPTSSMLRLLLLLSLCFCLQQLEAQANPEPDIPVRCFFNKDGTCQITVEVDPRCFTADPMRERYMMKVDLAYRTEEELLKLKEQAADAVRDWLIFLCEPEKPFAPPITLTFTGQNQAALVKADDPVVITATWKMKSPSSPVGWCIQATKLAKYAFTVHYYWDGVEQKRTATLFPGETSFRMDGPKAD